MDDMSHDSMAFGQALRAKRLEKQFSLRKFAELVGVSPTYLSQVEQSNVDPPTAERVHRIAELLGEDSDAWLGLAGRVSDELQEIIQKDPVQMSELLREADSLTPEQLGNVIEHARKMKRRKARLQA